MIQFRIYKGEKYYVAECIDLPIVTQGRTLDEVIENIGAVTSSLEIKKGRDLSPPMQLQIEIPLQLTIDIQNKKIPIQELTSALKGIEATILEFWRR